MHIVNFRVLNNAHAVGYLHEQNECVVSHEFRPAMVVCPGGGYNFVSSREADPVALEFFSFGFNVFILTYSVLESSADYEPLKELAQTVHIIRENSEKWNILKKRIAVTGFSAGGHLAASLGALWSCPEIGLPEDCRPDALVLGYPVITLGEFTHDDTCRNVTGGKGSLRELLSVEKQVSSHMPPVFVWHTVDDELVPLENTLLLVSSLKKADIPFECHIFAHGQHGLSICNLEVETPNPECREWIPLCKTWLGNLFHYIP